MNRQTGMLLGAGLLIGWLGIGTLRFIFIEDGDLNATHYHANFALFINGERVDLSDMKYMEDVASCRADPASVLPVDRAHLHSQVHDVVHVHHPGVTWGHFFANIGFTLRDDFIITDAGERFFADNRGGSTMKFIVNGQAVSTVYNRGIRSEDRLLISFGSEAEEEVTEAQFPDVGTTAAAFNASHFDPGGCTGGPPPETTGRRMRRAFWM